MLNALRLIRNSEVHPSVGGNGSIWLIDAELSAAFVFNWIDYCIIVWFVLGDLNFRYQFYDPIKLLTVFIEPYNGEESF